MLPFGAGPQPGDQITKRRPRNQQWQTARVDAMCRDGTATASLSNISIYENPSLAIIMISDTILESDIDGFKSALEQNLDAPSIEIFLMSSGGSVKAALDIGRMIRAVEISVEVPDGALCASSCALIFFGGVARTSYGKIGIHRPYFQIGPDVVPPTDSQINEMYSSVATYLADMGMPAAVFDRMMLTRPEDMLTFDGDSVFEVVPAIVPFKSERDTLFRAKKYGLASVVYWQTLLRAETVCSATYMQADSTEEMVRKAVVSSSCVDAALWGVDATKIESLKVQARDQCPVSEQDSIQFISYRADVLLRALEGTQSNEMELAWYGFPPFLEHEECVRSFFGR